MNDDLDPVSPADMVRIMSEQRRRTRSRLERGWAVILLMWAAAWLIGFFGLWSAEAIGGNPWWRVSVTTATIVFIVVMVVAITASIIMGVRSGTGMRGASALSGAMYGWSWTITMVGASFLLTGLQRTGLSPETIGVLYPAVFVFLTGVLYLAGGALWRAPVQFALGGVMILVAVGATFLGTPDAYLVYATAGPLCMIVVAVLMLRGILPAAADGTTT